ncbi:MAG TPA: efflux RND transporter periplasmic adaptor subunit [Armatimonadota bacterium]|nr:efflux RND transporter periplasmic adaptor subunit [Armatimonadota bacterium]
MGNKTKKKKRTYYWIAAIVVLAAIFIIRPLLKPEEKPIIRTVKVEMGTVTASVSANGVLQPLTTVEVKSNVGGQVVELAVDEGDIVQPGQLIARIDPTDTQTAYEQSQADLAAALSKVDQAREQLSIHKVQSSSQVISARQALEAAKAKLQQVQAQAEVQPKLTNASISQAQSNLRAAEAAYNQTKNALIPQKLSSAQAAYDQAKASYDLAQKDVARQKGLLEKGFVAKSVVDSAEERLSVAKAQLDSTKKKLDTVKDETELELSTAQARVDQAKAELENAKANSVQNQIRQQELASARAAVKQAEAALQSALATTKETRVRQGDIIQANAQVERSKAAVENTKTQLGYTTITAPRAGIVTKKYVEEGSIVTAGRSSFSGSGSGVTIVDIADTSRMFALVDVDETDIAQIKLGQRVEITVEAYPDEIFRGKVTKIAPQSVTEQNVTVIPVNVEIDVSDARLKPGMNASCEFITARTENVLIVPNEAITESDKGSTVTVIEGEKQIIRPVKTGLVGSDLTEIVSGLRQGEVVVTATIQPIIPGQMPNGNQGRSGGMRGPSGPGAPGGMRMRR